MSDTGGKEQAEAPRIYSYLEVERQKLRAEADRRINALSDQQLTAVSLWLEADVLTMMHELPELDNPMENVRMRGAIGHGNQLAAVLRNKVTERHEAAKLAHKEATQSGPDPRSEPEPDIEPELPRLIPGERYPTE